MFKKQLLVLSLVTLSLFLFTPQKGKADPDSFTFTSPTAGTTWMIGTSQIITWTKDPLANITNIKLYLLQGSTQIVTIANLDVPADEDSGSFQFTMPSEYNNGSLIQSGTYAISAWASGQSMLHIYNSAQFSVTANPSLAPDLVITGFSFAGLPSTNAEPISITQSDSGYHVNITIKNVGNIRSIMENAAGDAKVEIFVNNVLATYHYLHTGFSSIAPNASETVGTFIFTTSNVVPLGNANIKIVISNVPNETNTSNNTATRLYSVNAPPAPVFGVKVTNTPNIPSTLALNRGMTNVSLVDFKVKAIGSEGVKIDKLFFYIDQQPLTSLTNFRLYKGSQSWTGQVVTDSGGGHYWSTLTFNNITSIIPVGQETEFIIKADVPTTATIASELYLDYWYDYSSYSGATSGQTILSDRDRVKVSVGIWTTTNQNNNTNNNNTNNNNSNSGNNNSGSSGSNTSTVEIRTIKDQPLYSRLKGSILLKTEDSGKAYYVHPTNKKSYFLGRPSDAYAVMREQGIGITNNDLKKIPLGVEQMSGGDQDGDALSDLFEDAIGTDKNKSDSDNDGFSDRAEIQGGFNPSGSGKLSLNSNFSKGQQGRILLQVESRGEAWYINPKDNKRYFLGRANDAFYLMQNMGLGIANKDFNKLN